MALNLIKKYDSYLEINHLTQNQRSLSLRGVFDRDISDNEKFHFNGKVIRPLKREDTIDVESLFSHLTHKTEDIIDEAGVKVKKRDVFDFERSKRLHWIWPHLNNKIGGIEIFSANVRIRGKDVIRTFIFNRIKDYIIILEPQRSGLDYYLITAYYLEKSYGGAKPIKKMLKRKLDQVY